MKSPFTRKIALYSSVFITLALNSPKLLALRKEGIMAKVTRFEWTEWLTQIVINFVCCICIFYVNKQKERLFTDSFNLKKHGGLLAQNIIAVVLFASAGAILANFFFHNSYLPGAGYFFRLTLSAILLAIIFRIIAAVFSMQQKERENEQLRNLNLNMELELLKSQLNPHFFFNALSSLSGIVRENPTRAQQYISSLSRIFRYSLQNAGVKLVSLNEEMKDVFAYSELLTMRHENAFKLTVDIDPQWMNYPIPPMTLQPLLENALKHNAASPAKPLEVSLSVAEGVLSVRNPLQPVSFPASGTGIGLANLTERFRILMQKDIEIVQTKDDFSVNIPLK